MISLVFPKLELRIGERVILTDNIIVSDRLINGSIDTIKHTDMTSKPLFVVHYM